MFILFCTRTAYATGLYDSDLSLTNLQQFQNIAKTNPIYQVINIPWTNDTVVLSNQILQIQQIIKNKKQPVIIYDPILPRNFPDTLFAIAQGLADSYFKNFFQKIKQLQQQYDAQNFKPIFIIGSSINAKNTYSSNATQFVQVFQKLVLYARAELQIQCYFAVSYDPTICQPIVLSNCTQNCTLTQNQLINDYQTKLSCASSIQNFYPGDSFVDWFVASCINQDSIQSFKDIINKAMALATLVARTKPVMLLVGSKSCLNCTMQFENKNQQLLDIYNYTEQFSQTSRFYNTQIRALIFVNFENNKDIAFYNSVKGDKISQTTQNGAKLYYYLQLYNLFINSSAVNDCNLQMAAVGSICGPGQSGDYQFSDCRPCQTGYYQNKSGQNECVPCPISFYQDDVGQMNCKQCPIHATTVAVGTQLEKFCVCQFDYQMDDSLKCQPCPSNHYSKQGQPCQQCPSDAMYANGNGGPGNGCFCLAGFKWDSQRASCVKGSKSGDAFSISASVTVAAILVSLIL